MITDYKTLEKIKHKALEDAAKARELASNSTVDFVENVKGNTFYFNNYSDIHFPECDMNQLRKDLSLDAKIPNMFVGFGGDETNMALKDSVSSVYESVTSPEEELEMIIDIVEESGIKDQICYWEDGNHGLRLKKATSIRPGKYITNKLGIPEKHAENIARVVFIMDNPIKEGEQVAVVFVSRHGEKTSSNPGAKVDQTLNSVINRAVDANIDGHTHKIFFGSTKIQLFDANRKTPKEKTVYTVNFGARQENSTYPDEAGFPLTSKLNGEVLRVALVPNEAKTDFSLCMDFINRRDIINQQITSIIKKVDYELYKLEAMNFKNKLEVERVYKKTVAKLLQSSIKDYHNTKEIELNTLKEPCLPNKLYLAPLSGFVIGDPKVKNEKDIDKVISTIAKLGDSCKVILNGDMVHYKKADFWKKEKYPSHTFSYIELLAEKITPIKDKIIAYNSGVQETKIMNWHGEELAKMAMIRLQMDEKLAYMPYNKTQLLAEQKRIQSEKVEEYNKNLLIKEITRYERYPSLLNGLQEYRSKAASEPLSKEEMEHCIVKKLREEHKLLSLKADREIIDSKFPLDAIELRTPHINLVQHMVCQLAGIDPKKISINAEPEHDSFMSIKVKSPENKTMPINLIGSYSKSINSRGAQQNNLSKKEGQKPGANVYFVNARSGKEYITKGRSFISNPDGSSSIIDNFYISAGRFDGSQDRIEQEFSSNRLYKFEWTELEDEKKEIKGRGIYQNAIVKNGLVASSMDYDSVLYEDKEVLENMIEKQVLNSFNAQYDKAIQLEVADKKEKAKQLILSSLDKNKIMEQKPQVNEPELPVKLTDNSAQTPTN